MISVSKSTQSVETEELALFESQVANRFIELQAQSDIRYANALNQLAQLRDHGKIQVLLLIGTNIIVLVLALKVFNLI